MKKLFTILLCVFALAACAKKDTKDNLTLAVKGEVESLDPVFSYDGVTHGLLLNVYDTLIKFKGSSLTEFEPLIAQEVPSVENGLISKDGLTYKFNIRKDIKFHDGTPLTAQDVEYSLRRFLISDVSGGPSSLLLEPILGTPSTRDEKGNITANFKDIENAIKADGDTLTIKLKSPFAPFLSIIARWSYIISKDWAVKNGEWDGTEATWQNFNNRAKTESYLFEHENGSGPFIVQRWDIPAKRIYLAGYQNYILGAPALKTVQLLSISEQSTMRLMLESADADIVELSGSFAGQVAANPDAVVMDELPRLKTDPVIFFTFDINAQANPDIGSGKLDGQGIPANFFTDKDLRKAFAYSFDYDAFVNESMKGKAPRAIGPVPPGLVGYDKDAAHYSFDLKQAEEYFKKAWGGKVWENGFKFTLTYNTGSDMRQMAAEILKRNVESLNPKFKVELRGVPWSSFLEKTQARKMPLWVRGWIADYPDAHNFVFPFLHSKGRYAIAQNFNNPKLDALIDRAVKSTDNKERAKLYRQIQDISADEAAQIYTVHSPGVWVFRKEVKGFVDNPVFMGIYFYPIHKN
jgi:peptide/nickel transport system substrate-binding protein